MLLKVTTLFPQEEQRALNTAVSHVAPAFILVDRRAESGTFQPTRESAITNQLELLIGF